MIRIQQWIAHRLWALARKIEQCANSLFHHPFSFRRFICWHCEKPSRASRVRELHYGPHGYKPVCRKCYDQCPF